jgi:hypothetical protein
LAHHLDLAALDLRHPVAVRLHEAGLHVGHRFHGAPLLLDHAHLGARRLGELAHQAIHHHRPLEDVRVIEQVGLVGEDLLDPKAPLLIPGARQAQGLVPRRELDRACARIAAERHRERLEHDPGHVVFRLRLGQPE